MRNSENEEATQYKISTLEVLVKEAQEMEEKLKAEIEDKALLISQQAEQL